MKRFTMTQLTLALSAGLLAGDALAHDGRRFDIQVIDGQLVAQGYISGSDPVDDGNGVVRDYYNAIHGHWAGLPNETTPVFSSASLPGFDLYDQAELVGFDLYLSVLGVKKWSDAPFADFTAGGDDHGGHAPAMTTDHGDGFMPHFLAIPVDEAITVKLTSTGTQITGTPLLIDDAVGSEGHYDLTFDYFAGDPTLANAVAPTDALYLVELQLTAPGSGVAGSEVIHVILSPLADGSHHLSLATEQYLGTPVPEPGTLLGLAAVGGMLLSRRRRA